MKHLSLVILLLAIACDRPSDSKQNEPEADASIQDINSTPDHTQSPAGPAPADVHDTPETSKTGDQESNPVETPANQFKLDASSTTATAYFKLENGGLAPTTSDQAWQFNVKRTQFQSNSGTSGNLNFGVYETGSTDYASVTQCNAGPLKLDEMLPASGAPGSQPYSGNALLNAWYNYDAATHVVSSKKLVYLISDGTNCFKFQIQSYSSGTYMVLADALVIPPPPPPPAPLVYDQTIDASSTTDTTYLKLMNGQLAAATATDPWLLAVKRTQFQTNSGTSGTVGGGAYDSTGTDFSTLTSCAGLSFTPDAELPASGAPGSLPYSGNAVLNAWYNYDFATHIVSSKQLVYALSDGTQCLKLQILTYANGVYTVKVSQLQ